LNIGAAYPNQTFYRLDSEMRQLQVFRLSVKITGTINPYSHSQHYEGKNARERTQLRHYRSGEQDGYKR
jgi:hypothetical protein